MGTTVFSDIDWNKQGKQVGALFLPHSPDDDAWGVIPYPAASIRNGDGPVVVVSGGVHGDEYEGPVVIGELIRQIEPADVQGQLILLPAFNAPAQRAGRRTSPIDQLNLARVFPGDDFGSTTQQIARYVVVTGVIVAIMAALIPLEKLLELVNIGTLTAFAIVCVGVLILRVIHPGANRPFRAPAGPLVAVLGLAGCLYLISGLPVPTLIRFVVWFTVGVIIYAFYGYRHSRLRKEALASASGKGD